MPVTYTDCIFKNKLLGDGWENHGALFGWNVMQLASKGIGIQNNGLTKK